MKRYKSIVTEKKLTEANLVHIGEVIFYFTLKIEEKEVSKIVPLFEAIGDNYKTANFAYVSGNMKLKNLAKFVDNHNVYLLNLQKANARIK